jgi:hypothetical protein
MPAMSRVTAAIMPATGDLADVVRWATVAPATAGPRLQELGLGDERCRNERESPLP